MNEHRVICEADIQDIMFTIFIILELLEFYDLNFLLGM